MPKKNNPYVYRQDDSPISLAERFNLPPNALLEANPGAFPASTGQVINIPQAYQYNAPATTGPNVLTSPNSMTGSFLGGNPYNRTVNTGYSAIAPATGYNIDQRGRGYSQPTGAYNRSERGAPATPTNITPGSYSQSEYGVPGVTNPNILNSVIGRITANPAEYDNLSPAQKDAVDKLIEVRSGGAGGQTLGEGDFYGYERNPETGRDERVIKNAANGDNFLNELRYDPDRKKYVQIGKLMREGKLDKQGRWHKKPRRVRRGGGNQPVAQGAETGPTFTGFGVVNFGASSG
jgi:hypothetical protein